MTRVLFIWFKENSLVQDKCWQWLPECPAVGTTVHLPLSEVDPRGYTDVEGTKAFEVHRIAWTRDNEFWHAEVQLR